MAVKPFAETLRAMAGDIPTEVALELQRVLLAVTETGKAGKVTLTIDVKPVTKMQGAVSMKGKVTATVPANDMESVFFVTPEGNPSVNHPKQEQMQFGLREAGGEQQAEKGAVAA